MRSRMMWLRRRVVQALVPCMVLGVIGLGTKPAAGQAPIQLQAQTPGQPQQGHGNITGTFMAGAFKGDGSQLTHLLWSALLGVPLAFPPTGPAGGDLVGTYPNPTLGAGTVKSGQIAEGAVSTGKLTDGAVSTEKLADGVITPDKLVVGAVTTEKLQDGSVTAAKLAPASVTTQQLDDGAVTDAKVTSVDYSKITNAPAAVLLKSPAGGDLTGTYPNPTIAPETVAAGQLRTDEASLAKVSGGALAASNGQITLSSAAGGDLLTVNGASRFTAPLSLASGGITLFGPNNTPTSLLGITDSDPDRGFVGVYQAGTQRAAMFVNNNSQGEVDTDLLSTGTIAVNGSLDPATLRNGTTIDGASIAVMSASGTIVSVVGTANKSLEHGLVSVSDGKSQRAAMYVNDKGEGEVDADVINCTGSKNFKIDHPQDPANKYLYHAAIESDERVDIYSGNVTTNSHGEVSVLLPGYCEALNRDFRYQLTVVGQFAQAIVASEIHQRRFVIRTNRPHVKVSWQVTGVRQDAYAQAHPLQVEVSKSADERGRYLHPEVYGLPLERKIGYRPAALHQAEGLLPAR